MDFEYEEKLAIIRLLEKVAKADNKIMEEEMQVLLNAAKYLDLHESQIRESKEMSLHRVGEILKRMSNEKQEFITSTLLNLMTSDGVIERAEVLALIKVYLGNE